MLGYVKEKGCHFVWFVGDMYLFGLCGNGRRRAGGKWGCRSKGGGAAFGSVAVQNTSLAIQFALLRPGW